MRDDGPIVREITSTAYVIPTDAPEADGTLAWDKTIMVLASARAGTALGIGWSYAAAAAGGVITDVLAGAVIGRSAMDVPGAAEAMARAVRNIGRPGIAATAISAVDIALWDLKARLLGVSVTRLLGQARDSVPVYGSGGFTSYGEHQTREQPGGPVRRGIRRPPAAAAGQPPPGLRARRDAGMRRPHVGRAVGAWAAGWCLICLVRFARATG